MLVQDGGVSGAGEGHRARHPDRPAYGHGRLAGRAARAGAPAGSLPAASCPHRSRRKLLRSPGAEHHRPLLRGGLPGRAAREPAEAICARTPRPPGDGVTPSAPGALTIRTRVALLRQGEGLSRVALQLTGRTHQARAHLAYLGAPVLGTTSTAPARPPRLARLPSAALACAHDLRRAARAARLPQRPQLQRAAGGPGVEKSAASGIINGMRAVFRSPRDRRMDKFINPFKKTCANRHIPSLYWWGWDWEGTTA